MVKPETLNPGVLSVSALVAPAEGAVVPAASAEPTIDNYFVCVGAQKSGTTWLARVLADHPEVFVTPVKEIHYFDHIRGLTQHLSDRKFRSRYRKFHQKLWTQPHRLRHNWRLWSWYRDYMSRPLDDAWYVNLFRQRGGKTMAGEVTPEYALIGREGFEHIRRLAPAARVLYIMRNPVTQGWSQVLHHCRANGLDVTRLSAHEVIALCDMPRVMELGDYRRTLDELFAVFDAEQTRIFFYEDIHQDRARAIAEVCKFLHVGFAPAKLPGLTRRFNISEPVALPEGVRAHLRVRLKPQAEAVRGRMGRLPESWRAEFSI